jgi:hypothetical protein
MVAAESKLPRGRLAVAPAEAMKYRVLARIPNFEERSASAACAVAIAAEGCRTVECAREIHHANLGGKTRRYLVKGMHDTLTSAGR